MYFLLGGGGMENNQIELMVSYKKLMILRRNVLYLTPLKVFLGGILVVVIMSITREGSFLFNYALLVYFLASVVYLYVLSVRLWVNNICPFCKKEFFSKIGLFTNILNKNCQSCGMPNKRLM